MWYMDFGTVLCGIIIGWGIAFAIMIPIICGIFRQIRRMDIEIEKRTNKRKQKEIPIPKGKYDKK